MPEFRPGVVSIMIPTYNQAAYIADTIRSALAQTYAEIEILVADDASTDETRDVVGGFNDPRIKYYRNERNVGRVQNYQKALYEHATGAWAVNLDGDDYYIYPRFLEDSLTALSEHPGAILAFSEYARLDDGELAYEAIPNLGSGRVTVLDGNEFFFSMPGNPLRLRHMTTIYDRREAVRIGFYTKDIIIWIESSASGAVMVTTCPQTWMWPPGSTISSSFPASGIMRRWCCLILKRRGWMDGSGGIQ